MTEKLIALIEREGYGTATADTDLLELDIDSLDFIVLLQAIRAELGDIADDAAIRACTVGQLAACIQPVTAA